MATWLPAAGRPRDWQSARGADPREVDVYAPVEDVARASHCAMLFVLAENEELFDNRGPRPEGIPACNRPKKLVTVPKIKTLWHLHGGSQEAQQLAIDWYDHAPEVSA